MDTNSKNEVLLWTLIMNFMKCKVLIWKWCIVNCQWKRGQWGGVLSYKYRLEVTYPSVLFFSVLVELFCALELNVKFVASKFVASINRIVVWGSWTTQPRSASYLMVTLLNLHHKSNIGRLQKGMNLISKVKTVSQSFPESRISCKVIELSQ